jgi:hypothetical protein
MKRMSYFSCCLLSFISLPMMADTFTLKDGTSLEAVILSDVGDSYLLEVQFSKSIKDERRVLKSDVVKIQREQLDLKAFEPLAKLYPTPDLLAAEDYTRTIAAVSKFISGFPQSPKLKEAKAMLSTLQAESAIVAAGGIKFNGKMLNAAEYQANAYDLDARVQEARIRRMLADNLVLPALRAFSEFDRDYATSISRGALVVPIRQVIQNHLAEIQLALVNIDAITKKRNLGLTQMSSDDRQNTQNAINEEAEQIEANYKLEKAARQIWITTTPYHKASMEDAIRNGEAELKRINAVKTTLGVEGGKAFRDAWNAVNGGGDAAAVAAAIAAAKSALVPARYLAPLEEAAKKIK